MFLYLFLGLILGSFVNASMVDYREINHLSDLQHDLSSKYQNLPPSIRTSLHHKIKRAVFAKTSKQSNSGAVHKFTGFSKIDFLSSIANVLDVCIFDIDLVGQGRQLFNAAIVLSEGKTLFKIFKLNEKNLKWDQIQSAAVGGGTAKVNCLKTPKGAILLLSEKFTEAEDKLTLLFINDNFRFKKLQSINFNTIGEVVTKTLSNDIYLIVTHGPLISKKSTDSCTVYKWKDAHFDKIQSIPSVDAKISMSVILHKLFLGIASRDEFRGIPKSDSEIYKFDNELNKFSLHQKVTSQNPFHIEFFDIGDGNLREHFVLVVNNVNNEKSEALVHKYVDDLFIPFQAIDDIVPVQWTAIEAGILKLLLISSTSEALKVYQYNGWKFSPMDLAISKSLVPNTSTLKPVNLLGNVIIASVDTSGDKRLQFFNPTFVEENTYATYKAQTVKWCRTLSEQIKYKDLMETLAALNKTLISVRSNYLGFELSNIDEISTGKLVTDSGTADENTVQILNDVSKVYKAQNELATKITNSLTSFLNRDNFHTLPWFKAENIVLLGDNNIMNKVEVKELNNVFFDNVKELINFKTLTKSDDILVEKVDAEELEFKTINGIPHKIFTELIHKFVRKNGVVINGDVYANEGILVGGKLDLVKFTTNNILLKTGKQKIAGTMKLSELTAKTLKTDFINDMAQEDLLKTFRVYDAAVEKDIQINYAKVHDLSVSGLFGANHFSNIFENTLKLNGDQVVESSLYVNRVQSKGFENNFEQISVTSTDSNLTLNKVQFTKLAAKTLQADHRLNDLSVTNGKLSVLLLNSEKMQYLSSKVFENVEIRNSVTMQDNLKKSLMEEKGATKVSSKPLYLTGNYFLKGRVNVNGALSANNVINEDTSVKDIMKMGLKLTDNIIDVPVYFKDGFTVKNLNLDEINNIKKEDLITIPNPNEIVNFGKKHFLNVKVNGDCFGVKAVNGHDLVEFDKNVFRTNTDQHIYGNIAFNKLSVSRVVTNQTSMGGSDISKILTYSGNNRIKGTLKVDYDLTVDSSMKTNKLSVKGTLAGLKLDSVLLDTIYKGSTKYKIKSNKVFLTPLKLETLSAKNKFLDINAKRLINSLNWDKQIEIPSSVTVQERMRVKNIYFKTSMDGIDAKDFGKNWLLFEQDQEFSQPQIFNAVYLTKDLTVTEEQINGKKVQYLETILKIDEDTELNVVQAGGVISNYVKLQSNKINNIELPNIILKNGEVQTMAGPVSFGDGVTVMGDFQFNSFFGSDLVDIQDFLKSSESCERTLTVHGKAIFNKEPVISQLWSTDIADIKNGVWYLNTDQVIDQKSYFRNIVCQAGLTLEGTMNEISLPNLASSYLSRTSDQNILATSYFDIVNAPSVQSDSANVENALVPSLGRSLKSYAKEALFTENDIVINGNMQFDSIECKELSINGKVNSLDLNKDVILYTRRLNKINAFKQFESLKVNNLQLEDGATLNGINVNYWLSHAIYKNYSNQKIGGLKVVPYMSAKKIRVPLQ